MILTNITTSFELRPEADSTRMMTEADNPENVDVPDNPANPDNTDDFQLSLIHKSAQRRNPCKPQNIFRAKTAVSH